MGNTEKDGKNDEVKRRRNVVPGKNGKVETFSEAFHLNDFARGEHGQSGEI